MCFHYYIKNKIVLFKVLDKSTVEVVFVRL